MKKYNRVVDEQRVGPVEWAPFRHSALRESHSDPLLEPRPGCGGRSRRVKIRVEESARVKAGRWGESRWCDSGTSRPSVAAERGESAEWRWERWAGTGEEAGLFLPEGRQQTESFTFNSLLGGAPSLPYWKLMTRRKHS